MPDSLYWSTVTPLLKSILSQIMESVLFSPFRLVGGTSLSLQLGHRKSVDIDLFTDADYNSLDFHKLYAFLKQSFNYVSEPTKGLTGMGESYFIGTNEQEAVKLDLYYTDKFIQPALTFGQYRLATVEEIIAMKIDIVRRLARKKDFWDLHELLDDYSPDQMIRLHQLRYPYGHNESLIRKNFLDFSTADDDFEPICLKGKYWELIKLDIINALKK